ncbi:MAG: 3-dehydroquinate synthase II [Candidatus Thermoplasmatota archaeon]|nr:3-dehydroquinate synthase II [Candidatus Thermoplasmatota archaeon]MEC8362635.1 3-dehydroquinate synthase II [Candidatus Thermoplasmatota archaeon]
MEVWLDFTTGKNFSDIDSALIENVHRQWHGESKDVAEVAIDGFRGQEEAASLVGLVDWILLRCSDWTMIPLENIISASRGTGTRIAAAVSSSDDITGAGFALEHGVDAVLIPPKIDLLNYSLAVSNQVASKERTPDQVQSVLQYSEVTEIAAVGIGDRVCVDLIDTLELGEGLLVGSTANAMVMVHGETVPSEYVPTRPFRVNAGAVHSYCLMADQTTKYLSELVSGDKVSVINLRGTLRHSTVGRVKIEKRPFLLVKYSDGRVSGQAALQQAETIRLVGDEGLVSVTNINVGDRVLTRISTGMRHIGRELDGVMNER